MNASKLWFFLRSSNDKTKNRKIESHIHMTVDVCWWTVDVCWIVDQFSNQQNNLVRLSSYANYAADPPKANGMKILECNGTWCRPRNVIIDVILSMARCRRVLCSPRFRRWLSYQSQWTRIEWNWILSLIGYKMIGYMMNSRSKRFFSILLWDSRLFTTLHNTHESCTYGGKVIQVQFIKNTSEKPLTCNQYGSRWLL